jgi:ATP-binding cassette subfamily A (ABC1) protein 1
MFNYSFQLPSTAYVLISCLNIFIGVVSTLSTSVVEQLSRDEPDLKAINDVLKPLFIILMPHYCLGRGIVDLSIQYNVAQSKRSLGADVTYSPFDFDIIGRNLLALFVQGIVFFFFNLLIQYRFFIRFKPSKTGKSIEDHEYEDENVHAERLRILNLTKFKKKNRKIKKNERNLDDKDYIKLINMTKVYSKLGKKCEIKRHVAVDSLCLGIDKGECFGLIGINGAGKSKFLIQFSSPLYFWKKWIF